MKTDLNAFHPRNQSVDILRGLAMLLVVLGHTMAGCTIGSQNTFVFNVIWSLQMPLFILISGYVTRYSRPMKKFSDLLQYLKRRTLAYLLPWAVWSFLVRGLLFGEQNFLNWKWLLWHMDSGYWFLTTLWAITVLFGISLFLANRLFKTSITQQAGLLLFYSLGMGILYLIGQKFGLAFLGIKLTLYYMPFYFTGYLFGKYQHSWQQWDKQATLTTGIIAICFTAWLYALFYLSLFTMADTGYTVLIRSAVSLAGCVAVTGLGVFYLTANGLGKLTLFFQIIGVRSLEIYLTHYVLLNLLTLPQPPFVKSIAGISLVTINFLLTVTLSLFVIKILSTNKILKFILFGKNK